MVPVAPRSPPEPPRGDVGYGPKLTDDDIEAAKAMLANPDIGVTQIAQRLGVSPATLYRYIPPHEPQIPRPFERGVPERPEAPGAH